MIPDKLTPYVRVLTGKKKALIKKLSNKIDDITHNFGIDVLRVRGRIVGLKDAISLI